MMEDVAIEAVVFDLDGTLIDTEPYYRQAFHAAVSLLGLPVPDALYASLLGVATPDRKPLLRQAFGADFPLDTLIATYYQQRESLLPARIPLRPGAAALLHRLRLPSAIATSASRRTAAANLARAGIAHRFRHVVTRDDVARGKPAPDVYLLAARLLQVAPRACLAVEDSVTGLLSAQQAGMSVAALGVADAPASRCVNRVTELAAIEALIEPARKLRTFRPGSVVGATTGLRNLS